jgi:carboxypeptidase Q
MKRILLILVLMIIMLKPLDTFGLKHDKIEQHRAVAEKIIQAALADSSSYDRLAYITDMFGPRLCGSQNLENALEWAYQEMLKDGMDNVRKDPVMVPHWVRGNEFCTLNIPWKRNMPMLGFGGSIGTPSEGITAKVITVQSKEELFERADEIKGNIVCYNAPWQGYGKSVQFRYRGAIWAAQAGAIAGLCRSVSPKGMQLPHTGSLIYADTVPEIPHAAITAEDAMLLQRLQDRGITPEVTLYMEAKTLPDVESYNLMCELKGTENPEEIIALGGHSDSWDAGTGAHDDASGCIAAWEAIKLLKELGINPKRTLRAVFWANEENGVRGAEAYAKDHGDEPHALVFEFDSGVFPPSEIRFTGNDQLFDMVKSFKPLLELIDNIDVVGGGGGVDIGPMMRKGVPGMSLNTDDQGKYFWYHHSDADTIDKIDPLDFQKCVAAIALSIYLYDALLEDTF